MDADVKTVKTFFSEIYPRYSVVTEDGKISTIEFLEASKALVKLHDHFGAALYVAKKDMIGNIDKLYRIFHKAPEKYGTINDLIFHEKNDSTLYAVDALLWLRRALEFIFQLLSKVFVEKGEKTDNIYNLIMDAYNQVLKRYHGWIVQNTFKVLLKAFPCRSDLVKTLTYEADPQTDEDLCKHISDYLVTLGSNINTIKLMYDDWGLNVETKV